MPRLKEAVEDSSVATLEPEESIESLQQSISELNKRLKEKEEEEDEEEDVWAEMPIADIHLKIERGTSFTKMGVTPAELLILVAMHHPGAGGNPVEKITFRVNEKNEKITTRVKVRDFKNWLVGRYGVKRVEAVYSGILPKFPKTFRQALNLGIDTKLPTVNLFDYKVMPNNISGGGEE